MDNQFEETISTRERLREIIDEPSDLLTNKTTDHIDPICQRFIAASPYILVASKGSDGLMDLSPKGDAAGFVYVVDKKTLAIPDRLGNNRADTFENLFVDSQIGIIFIIPGYNFTLRVSGTGSIVRDTCLQEKLSVGGKVPNLILAVTVEEAFMHCAKSMARSNIWKPEAWPDISDVPTLAEAMVAHGKLAETRIQMQDIIDHDFENRMY
ncbi:MAG: MSMEG_1061 family FMN-dependent PPOX-type flavoprotein [Pseudoalteromonas distincta]